MVINHFTVMMALIIQLLALDLFMKILMDGKIRQSELMRFSIISLEIIILQPVVGHFTKILQQMIIQLLADRLYLIIQLELVIRHLAAERFTVTHPEALTMQPVMRLFIITHPEALTMQSVIRLFLVIHQALVILLLDEEHFLKIPLEQKILQLVT